VEEADIVALSRRPINKKAKEVVAAEKEKQRKEGKKRKRGKK
jgi:hypothetical protein